MQKTNDNKCIQFIKDHENKIIPLSEEAARTYFNATISGNKEDYTKAEKLEIEINKIYSSKKDFDTLKNIKDSGGDNNSLNKRQLEILYNEYLSKQQDPKLLQDIVQLQIKNENIYTTHRVKINGNVYSDNQIDKILKDSTETNELQTIYLASKDIGQIIEKDAIKLIQLRNQLASNLGFKNYHEMSLILSEQDPAEIDIIFDSLDNLTRNEFSNVKNEIDSFLANRLNINKNQLMPWHYQNRFFQEAPEIYDTNLDLYFEDQNIENITKKYFSSIGLSIDDIIKRSDLYEKKNKYQHAYCIDIDRSGDIRVVCNIKPNANWMGTMLHEFGHAVYDKYIDKSLPWILRTHAHIFTTEAIAMFFGRLASDLDWISKHVNVTLTNENEIKEKIQKNLQINLLVFSRWSQVMYRFEKSMYEFPQQNLNKLWWDLVEEYQQINRPVNRNSPDWAAKIHLALYPAYYHNYLLGELLASQIRNNLLENYGSFFEGKKVGKFLKNAIFYPGAKYNWKDLIINSTGEQLNPSYFVKDVTRSV